MLPPHSDNPTANNPSGPAPQDGGPADRVTRPAHLPVAVAADGPAAPPAALSSAPNVWGLLAALRRRWVLAISVGLLLAAGAAAAIWFMSPAPKGTAWITFRINETRPRIFFPTKDVAAEDFGSYQRGQAALVRSRPILRAALRQDSLKGKKLLSLEGQLNKEEWLEKEVKVDFNYGPEFMRISMTGDHPDELALLLKALSDVYKEKVIDKEKTQRQEHLAALEKVLGDFEDKLKESRTTLRNLGKQVGANDKKGLEEAHKADLEQLSAIRRELIQMQTFLWRTKVEAALEQDKEKGLAKITVPEHAVEAAVDKDPTVLKLRASIADLEDKVASLKRYAPNSSARWDREDDLRDARKALDRRAKEIRPRIAKEMRENLQRGIRSRIDNLKDKTAGYEALQKYLNREAEALIKRTSHFSDDSMDVEENRTEVARINRIVQAMGDEIEFLKVELKAPDRVQLLDDDVVITRPPPKNKVLVAGFGAIGAFGLALFGISFWEFRARRVNTVDEVVQGLGLRLVGTLPALSSRKRRLARADDEEDSLDERVFLESVDGARTMLLHACRTEALRVVMVTSALQGEGKTSVASHLAISLARAGCKTLLIDGDMRSPSAHLLFDIPLEPGLAELLRDEAPAGEAVRCTAVDNLWMLPAGEWDGDLIAALAQGKVGAVIDGLKGGYDFVVVDSPPVLPVTDSLLIGQQADAVLFSILRDVSRLPAVYAAQQRLAMLGVRMLGAVVNGAGGGAYGRHYSSYHAAYGA